MALLYVRLNVCLCVYLVGWLVVFLLACFLALIGLGIALTRQAAVLHFEFGSSSLLVVGRPRTTRSPEEQRVHEERGPERKQECDRRRRAENTIGEERAHVYLMDDRRQRCRETKLAHAFRLHFVSSMSCRVPKAALVIHLPMAYFFSEKLSRTR